MKKMGVDPAAKFALAAATPNRVNGAAVKAEPKTPTVAAAAPPAKSASPKKAATNTAAQANKKAPGGGVKQGRVTKRQAAGAAVNIDLEPLLWTK